MEPTNKPTLTDQQIFDMVVTHLLTQNKKSSIKQHKAVETCVYKSCDGTQCAAGIFLDDSIKTDEDGYHNTRPIASIPIRFYKYSIKLSQLILLSSLQHIHDHYPPNAWERQLAERAVCLGLTFNPPAKAWERQLAERAVYLGLTFNPPAKEH